MERTGWEHHDLEKEIISSNTAQLLELFKRETEKFNTKCKDYVTNMKSLTEEGKKKTEDEITLINEGRQLIAMTIAEVLTDTKRIQRKVVPSEMQQGSS